MTKTYNYDVVLSFAGEDRKYVEAVANNLQSSNIKVFYDKFEQVNLWGKDLYVHLDEVYRNKARFCVMFISENYRNKNWTNHERESAQARAFQENEEYILPARFDDTEIPGVRPTVAYVSLRNLTPQKFAQKILQKLKRTRLNKSSLIKSKSGASYLKTTEKVANNSRQKSYQSTFSQSREMLDKSKYLKHKTKTVDLTLEGIGQLLENRAIIYKILTKGGKNNFTGIAKRGKVQTTLQDHLQGEKNYIPGSKVFTERMDTLQEAQKKANRIIRRTMPKYNLRY